MKIKGHTSIILTDVKTGKVERHEDDNLITNAIANYFQNCGFMNYPNVDRTNLVVQLLGGVMAFDDEISESASTVHVPAGLKMIANGSIGTVNNGEVLEMGSYSSTESGWQDDGSFIQTYDYTTSQANGTIACVCLTGRDYGYVGEGNSISHVRHSSRASMTNLYGSVTSHSGTIGMPFNFNFSDSSCYTFAIETRIDSETEEEYVTGVLRKYRLPISKINLKSKPTVPILLSEQEISIDNDLKNAQAMLFQTLGTKLILWNNARSSSSDSPMPVWGVDYTQYVWEVSANGTITKTTVTNTTGNELNCLGNAIFDGNYCFFMRTYCEYIGTYNYYNEYINSDVYYIWNRTTGTMTRLENPYNSVWGFCGRVNDVDISYRSTTPASMGMLYHGSGDGRVVTHGTYPIVIDGVTETIYPNNADTGFIGTLHETGSPLIRASGINLFRDQGYIASINNLDTPVVKTAEKTMKIIYRLTFEDV